LVWLAAIWANSLVLMILLQKSTDIKFNDYPQLGAN